jgi:hypothetical protein
MSKLTKTKISQLEKIGYHLIKDSNPPKFSNDGGQFCGGYWEVSLEKALKSLEYTKQINEMFRREFGTDYIRL